MDLNGIMLSKKSKLFNKYFLSEFKIYMHKTLMYFLQDYIKRKQYILNRLECCCWERECEWKMRKKGNEMNQ